MMRVVQAREKRRLAAVEKLERDRIKALKNDDEEAYMKMISETKNERISHLMDQTAQFLTQIGELVKTEQNEQEAERIRDDKERQLIHLEELATQGDIESATRAEEVKRQLSSSAKDLSREGQLVKVPKSIPA